MSDTDNTINSTIYKETIEDLRAKLESKIRQRI